MILNPLVSDLKHFYRLIKRTIISNFDLYEALKFINKIKELIASRDNKIIFHKEKHNKKDNKE